MKRSVYTNYDELPLFLNAEMVAKVLGISISSAYELMHETSFPALRVGSRIVVPKEKFCQWVESQTGGVQICAVAGGERTHPYGAHHRHVEGRTQTERLTALHDPAGGAGTGAAQSTPTAPRGDGRRASPRPAEVDSTE